MSEKGGQIDAVQDGRLRTEKERNRLIVNDGTTDILLAGLRLDGTIAVELARAGIDVKVASDDELIFSSRFNLFKIIDSDTVELTLPDIANGSTQMDSVSIPHTLGYAPIVIAFSSRVSPQTQQIELHMFGQSIVQARSVSTSAVTIGYLSAEKIQSSETSIYFEWSISNATGLIEPGGTESVRYFLLTETAPAA